MNQNKYIGIDVSKDKLDIFRDDKNKVITNTKAAISKFISSLKDDEIIIFEASGGYERLLASLLNEAGKPFCLENPKKIRDFARACGILAKTDKIDAQVIANFGTSLTPRLASHVDIELIELVARRDQLVEMRVEEKNRKEKVSSVRVIPTIEANIKSLTQQIELIEDLIKEHISSDPTLKNKYDILISYVGIGCVAAQVLLAYMPELGSLDKAQIVALAGLAPINRDSGKMRGKRTIYGGRTRVRCALYMAALSASRHNKFIILKKHTLAQAKKPNKVILTACARKILIHLNAMIKNNSTFCNSIS